MRRIIAILREACVAALAQSVASSTTVLIVAGMMIAVMLTTGRTVGAEQEVLGTIDSVGTRTIVVRAEADAGLTASVMERVSRIDGIEWAGGFSTAVDATNAALPDGTRVPVRLAFGTHFERLGIPEHIVDAGRSAYASDAALRQLGLPDGAGAVELDSDVTYGVVGRIDSPEFLDRFEPLVLVPQPESDGTEQLDVLVVVARDPALVAPVDDAVRSMLAVDDASKVTVETSEGLAQLRSVIEGQLGSFSRGLVLVILAITGVLVAIVLFSLVMLRRRDFGRRRALGATRGLIVGLLVAQTTLLAAAGAVVGAAASTAVLLASGDPLPGAAYFTAIGVLALATAVVAALIPAVVASHREPIKELRVP